MIKKIINHRFVKSVYLNLCDRPSPRSLAEEIACSISLLFVVMFSNTFVTVLSIFLFLCLLKIQKAKNLPWPYIVIIAVQISSYIVYVFLKKMEIFFLQGFFLQFGLIYDFTKKICTWSETLFIVIPLCLTLIFFKQKKILAVFFLLCAIFSQLYFLPIVGVMLILKMKMPVVFFITLWIVENYMCSLYLLELPVYAQWIDLVLFVLLMPICVVVFDVPKKIKNLRRV